LSRNLEQSALAVDLSDSHAAGRAHRESDFHRAVLIDRSPCPTSGDRFDARVRLSCEWVAVPHQHGLDGVVLDDVPPRRARGLRPGGGAGGDGNRPSRRNP